MKYCKVISAVMGSVLLFIMVSVFVPVYADAQDFDKSIVTNRVSCSGAYFYV